MTAAPELVMPHSLEEAVGCLAAHEGSALVVAGATAVSLMLHHRLVQPSALVALANVPGLTEVVESDLELQIGALVTHREMATISVVRARLPVLAATFAEVGNHRVRAAATVGGVLAEADYASDPPATLMVLDATVDVVGPSDERRVAVADLVTGYYETSLDVGEVIRSVHVPLLPPDAVAVYCKYRSTTTEDRPCIGVAAVVRLAEDGTCADLRVCVGAASAVPFRIPEVEQAAQGRRLDDSFVAGISDAYAESARPIADVRGSAWYRREMIRVWVARALKRARDRDETGDFP